MKNRKLYSRLTLLGIITGVIIFILSKTIHERPFWLDVVQLLWVCLAIFLQIWGFILNKTEKIENVNDEEIKQLLKAGKKKEAIKKVFEDSKCGFLNAILYVGDLEKTLNNKV